MEGRALVMVVGLFGGWVAVCLCAETVVPLPLRSISPRQSNQSGNIDGEDQGSSAGDRLLQWLGSYWYVLLVVLVILLVVSVFLCACILRKRRTHHHTLPLELANHSYIRKSPDNGHGTRPQGSSNFPVPRHPNSSVIDLPSMSPVSFSTQIPSPQPSFTSQRSISSHGRSSRRTRKRNHSPGHSSGSEETIRPPETYSVSSLVSLSSAGHCPPGLNRKDSISSAERSLHPPRGHRGHKRTTSNSLVKVTPLTDEANVSLHSVPSTTSMLSLGSSHSARSSKSQSDASSQQTVVKVDVKVNLGPDQEQEARMVTAAALAESARQLAQSAAEFGKEEEWYTSPHSHRPPLATTRFSTTHSLQPPTHLDRRRLFPSHSSSYLPNSRPCSPRALQTISLDRPVNHVSVDRPIHTFPIHQNRHRYDYKPFPSPLSMNPKLSRSPPSSVPSRSPTSIASRSPTLAFQSNSPPPMQRYLHSYGSGLESHTPRQQPDSDMHRQSPLSFTSLDAGEHYHYRPPSSRQFHTLEACLPWPRPEFQSLKSQPRYRTVNGILPLRPSGANGPTLRNLNQCLEDDVGTVGSNGSNEIVSGIRNGSLKSKERRLNRLKSRNGRVSKEEDQDENLHGGDSGGELDSDAGTAEDHLQASPVGLNACYSTLPHYSLNRSKTTNMPPPPFPLSPTSSSETPAHVRHVSPPRHTRRGKRMNGMLAVSSDPDLREMSHKKSIKDEKDTNFEGRVVSTASTSSTPPHSPTSTCLSSHTSSLPSINNFNKEHDPSLERQNSLPDVKDLQESAAYSTHHHSKTQSLPRSNSGLSIEGQLSSTASGYAATGSGSSLDIKSCGTPNRVNHKLEDQKLEAQYSYPLQKLLAQPYNPETDDFDLLDPPLEHIHHTYGHQDDCRRWSDDPVSHTPSHPHTHTHPHPPLHPHSADSNYSENHLIESRLGSSCNVYSSSGSSSSAIRLSANVPTPLRSPADLYTEHSHGNITIEV